MSFFCNDPDFYQSCFNFFRQNISAEVCLADMSKEIGISKWILIRKFKLQFGVPPLKFLWYLRLNYSIQLLMSHRRHSLAYVYCQSGFSSQAHYTRRFKEHFGLTPAYFSKENFPKISFERKRKCIYSHAFFMTILFLTKLDKLGGI